jgi:two-component system LytT family response regulator
MTIRALVVDDEPVARERIATLLRAEPDVELVAECGDGRAAVRAIHELSPHLVFLDIQMPDRHGFHVVESLQPDHPPFVIFVTSCDTYALKAFEVRALDYLLKPVERSGVTRALARARKELAHLETDRVGRHANEKDLEPTAARRHPDRLVVRSNGRVFFLRARDIDWIEAAGNYLRLHVGSETHMVRQTMGALEEQLNPEQFLRIHRSQIVNLDRIRELQPLFNGEYAVILQTGKRLTLSRGYRERVQRRLGDAI